VTGVLAMMFLVLFSSLALAMAVMSKGNLRASQTYQRVISAQASVDTGFEIARARLDEAVSRFVVLQGEITPEYARELWNGSHDSDTISEILPPFDGREEASIPRGIAHALQMHHASDAEADMVLGVSLGSPPAGTVRAEPIALERNPSGEAVSAVQIDYEQPDASGLVRVTVTSYEWDWLRQRWVTRVADQQYQIGKTVEHAIITPSRLMLGRNVAINGPIGIRYDSASLDRLDGPPLVSASDFEGLDSGLNAKLAAFRTAVLADDVDGDNRLRLFHEVESRSMTALNLRDFNADSTPDNAYQDYTRDNVIDEFDIFLKHFDTVNGEPARAVVLSADLKDGTPAQAETTEFAIDDALGLLIDSGFPDRNANGRVNGRMVDGEWDWTTFPDNNGDGELNELDLDADDVTLGYRDGVLDWRDEYAKVRGSAYFSASRADWEASRDEYGVLVSDYQQYIKGTLLPGAFPKPVHFDASDEQVPEFTEESFADAAQQMGEFAEQPGVESDGFEAVTSSQQGDEYVVEGVPYGAPSPADWYRRPVYRGLTFRNTVIPQGTNALFIECTFVGVTRVQAWQDNTHPSWTFYGEQTRNPQTGALSQKYPPPPNADQSPAALDKSYSVVGAQGYDLLPNPLLVDLDGDGGADEVCYDTKLVSNNLRFHDCVFIGSIVADKPVVFTHVRNKIVFTGATKFVSEHPTEPANPEYLLTEDEKDITRKSSMMLPHYSVDIGTNNSPASQDVQLKGAVIAGVLDIRGNADIVGALLMTFKPVYGEAPLEVYGTDVGNPADFNVTLGYFGPDQGDEEGIDLTGLRDLDNNGTLDVGWDSARDSNGALVPLGTAPQQESWYDGIPESDANSATHIRRAIPFNGFGKITLSLDPDLVLPDGLAAPLSLRVLPSSYREGRFLHEAVAEADNDDAGDNRDND
jgi:hypothetical protein